MSIRARIHNLYMIKMSVFMFKLVLSFCVKRGPWPLTGKHSDNALTINYAPSVFAFVKESAKRKEDECKMTHQSSAVF